MKGVLPIFFIPVFLFLSFAVSGDIFGHEETENGPADRFSPQEVMEAFAKAYPYRITRSGFYRGDWGVLIDGTWYLYAGGRLLSEDVLFSPDYDKNRYARYPLYRYSSDLPPVRSFSGDEIRRIEAALDEREKNPPYRHPGIFNALWRIDSSKNAWNRMKTAFFLGKKILIHRDLLEDLARVEEDILAAAAGSAEVRRYVDSIVSATGYNYRLIAGTRSLSFHSYGFAVDVIPASYGGKAVYWLWARGNGLPWYSLEYEKRYMPPPGVISIWEKHGFVWGGKWFHFDAMHFEYRPEILILNGIKPDAVDYIAPWNQ